MNAADPLVHEIVVGGTPGGGAGPGGPGDRRVAVIEPHPDGPADRPVAVMVAGLGGAWVDWIPVARALGPGVRCLVYDRPGVGGSPAHDAGTRQLDVAAADLLAALDALGIERAVLVGHSLGAWYVEAAARVRPDHVAGLVLVDGTLAPWPRPDSPRIDLPDCRRRHRTADRATALLHRLARVPGLLERLGPLVRVALEGRPVHRATTAEQRRVRDAVYARPSLWPPVLHEWAADPRMRAQLAGLRRSTRLPGIPVTALVAARIVAPVRVPWLRLWTRAFRRWRDREPAVRARLVVVARAPHLVMLTHPERVAAAVRGVLDAHPDPETR